MAPKPQDSNDKTAGNEPQKVSMLRGSVLARSLRGKPFTLDLRGSPGYGCEAHSGLIGAPAGVVWAALAWLGWLLALLRRLWVQRRSLGLVAVKQNSSEAKPLSCEHLVGVRRFELLTSSVSGKRSPPELNARSRVRECARNNITELPPSGKNYFLKSGDLRPSPSRCGANSTRKVAFVPPMNCTFA